MVRVMVRRLGRVVVHMWKLIGAIGWGVHVVMGYIISDNRRDKPNSDYRMCSKAMKTLLVCCLTMVTCIFLILSLSFESSSTSTQTKVPVPHQKEVKNSPSPLTRLNTETKQRRLKLRYKPPHDLERTGKSFQIENKYLRQCRLDEASVDYVTLKKADDHKPGISEQDTHSESGKHNVEDFVFGTAANSRYYTMSLNGVATIHQYKPGYKIIYYDLGLSKDQRDAVKQLCDVEYRKFDFSSYPKHVKDLHTYAWKPIIINELLLTYAGVFWMDSSVRLITSNFSNLFEEVIRAKGMIQLTTCGHSNFAVTHQGMYDYLPTDLEEMKRVEQRETTMLLYRTKPIYEYVVRWLTMCALQPKCIAPTDKLGCNFKDGDRYTQYANCHRFDQSATNILMSNLHSFNSNSYYATFRVAKIERFFNVKYLDTLNQCPKDVLDRI